MYSRKTSIRDEDGLTLSWRAERVWPAMRDYWFDEESSKCEHDMELYQAHENGKLEFYRCTKCRHRTVKSKRPS
eukprot:g29642.t1